MAIKPLHQELADWWAELSPEGQAEYLAEHPDSKKAQQVREEQRKAREERPSHKAVEKHEQKKAGDKPADKPGDKHGDKKDAEHQEKVSKMHATVQKFFKTEQDKPGSPARKKVAHHVKKKSGILVSAIKDQVKEWKGGVKAIHKLVKKQELHEHDKEALKALAKDAVYVVAGVAIGGGLAHGIIGALHHIGYDVLKDLILKSAAKAVVESSVEVAASKGKGKDSGDDRILKAVVDAIADAIENADIPKDAWAASMGDKQAKADAAKPKGKDKGKDAKSKEKK